jgi:hypothetical protein
MADIWMDVDAALSEVPVNILPLIDATDFKTRKESVAYNAAGLELIWHFTTTAGATSATVVTPTTGGAYDWAHQGGGMYTIEIPASGGASINNDTEGFGWFTGKATGVLPWRGPIIGFRSAGLNNLLIDDAYSTTRGLAGTALPDAAADAAGGLPISDAGGLDLDAQVKTAVDAIKAKTDNLPASPAAVGSAMTLADDAITAAKFDESTAFPLKSADTGATAVARTGADSDTLETLSDEIAAVTAPTAAAVADAVWDEAVADHAGVGSTGAALAAAGGSGDPWATALPGAYGAGTAGKIVGDNLNATVSSRSSHDAAAVKTAIEAAGSHLALIKAKTDNLPASPAATGAQMDLIDAPNATALTALAVAILDTLLSEGDADALNARTVRSALRALRNKSSIAAGVLTVCKENDSDSAWTGAVTTDGAAEPITVIDPT